MMKPVLLFLALSSGLLLSSTAASAQTIQSASVSGSTLTINGVNLGKMKPTVILNGTVLAVTTASSYATQVVATVPALAPASYLLRLLHAADRDDGGWTTFELAIGGVGPAGPQGAMGLPGATGANGQPGPQGIAGAAGPQGLKGDTGAGGPMGPQGFNGAAGPQGLKGDTGANGPMGLTGSAGATGSVGPTGNTGAAGPAGIAGPQGIQGYGFSGATLPVGDANCPFGGESHKIVDAIGAQVPGTAITYVCNGATGDTGPAGAVGQQGPAGAAGPQGAAGATGPQGVDGATGPQGVAGANGAAGAQGTKGDKGDTGPIGPAGPAGSGGSGNLTKSIALYTSNSLCIAGEAASIFTPKATYPELTLASTCSYPSTLVTPAVAVCGQGPVAELVASCPAGCAGSAVALATPPTNINYLQCIQYQYLSCGCTGTVVENGVIFTVGKSCPPLTCLQYATVTCACGNPSIGSLVQ